MNDFKLTHTPVMFQKCPVCEGVGSMPHNFYTRVQASSSISEVQCKTCNGQGIIYMNDSSRTEATPGLDRDKLHYLFYSRDAMGTKLWEKRPEEIIDAILAAQNELK